MGGTVTGNEVQEKEGAAEVFAKLKNKICWFNVILQVSDEDAKNYGIKRATPGKKGEADTYQTMLSLFHFVEVCAS